MSLAKIDRIIDELRYERFRWTPVRRVNIPKPNGNTRALGIPTWTDKLLQEVIRMILEAYYEPQFSDRSHGFRPDRGCHTALGEVVTLWCGVCVVSALSGPSRGQPEASLQGERRHRLSCRPQTLGVPVASWCACLIRPSICAGFSCCPLLARPGDNRGAGRAGDVVVIGRDTPTSSAVPSPVTVASRRSRSACSSRSPLA